MNIRRFCKGWRCLFGHNLHRIAPLYTRCVRCGQAFFTDYFASRARGYCVRIPVSQEEARRAESNRTGVNRT